jgi:3-mercaptopyruvate sulfurtransferase SseA
MALREITVTINVRSPSNFEAQKNNKNHIPRAINLENRDEKVDTTSRKPMSSQL